MAATGTATPKTRTAWWQEKFDRNVANDRKNTEELKALGWQVIVVWQCELKSPQKILEQIILHLDSKVIKAFCRQSDIGHQK